MTSKKKSDLPEVTELIGIVRIHGPFHASEFRPPHGPTTYYVSFPEALKLKARLFCKYCHTTHWEWWPMKEADFGRNDVVLCGRCLHTSCKEDIASED